jgi:hypothetical protein
MIVKTGSRLTVSSSVATTVPNIASSNVRDKQIINHSIHSQNIYHDILNLFRSQILASCFILGVLGSVIIVISAARLLDIRWQQFDDKTTFENRKPLRRGIATHAAQKRRAAVYAHTKALYLERKLAQTSETEPLLARPTTTKPQYMKIPWVTSSSYKAGKKMTESGQDAQKSLRNCLFDDLDRHIRVDETS